MVDVGKLKKMVEAMQSIPVMILSTWIMSPLYWRYMGDLVSLVCVRMEVLFCTTGGEPDGFWFLYYVNLNYCICFGSTGA